MIASRRFSSFGGSRRLGAVWLGGVLLCVGASVLAEQATAPTLTISIEDSTVYAEPVATSLETALLVVTPAWEDLSARTPFGGPVPSGQPLFVSDLSVVLSNRSMDCTTVFGPREVTTDEEFVIVAGLAQAYLPAEGFHMTDIGKAVVDTTGEAIALPLDRFSVDANYTSDERDSFSKDRVRGGDGELVLHRTDNDWTAELRLDIDEVTAEGKIPLTTCPIATRMKETTTPLLGEKRLNNSANNFGS